MSHHELDEKINVKKLLDSIYFAEEAVAEANLNQAKLTYQASRYFVQLMRKKLALQNRFDLKKSELSLYYRTKLSRKKGKTPTEAAIKERVMPHLNKYENRVKEAEIDLELAKQLLGIFSFQRANAIKHIFDARRNETSRQLYDLEHSSKHKKLREASKLARNKYRDKDDD